MAGATRANHRARRAIELAAERLGAARELGAAGSAELAFRRLAGTRRQFGLRMQLERPTTVAPIHLAVEDSTSFSAFRDLADGVAGRERLEVLWYARLADEG